jgi:membrane-associated phospholipid phosphatase
VIFALYPVAPPRFIPELGFADTVDKRAIFNNILLPPSLTNTYAAMPSLHAGWNLLVGIALVRHGSHWATRAFGVVMPVMMFFSIVFTGNHYIIDGIAGDAIAEFGLLVALAFARRGAEERADGGMTLAPS